MLALLCVFAPSPRDGEWIDGGCLRWCDCSGGWIHWHRLRWFRRRRRFSGWWVLDRSRACEAWLWYRRWRLLLRLTGRSARSMTLSRIGYLTISYSPAPAREAPVTPDWRDASCARERARLRTRRLGPSVAVSDPLGKDHEHQM